MPETDSSNKANLPDSEYRLRLALQSFIRPRLNWAAHTVLTDLNPSLPGMPEGITNPVIVRFLKDRKYTDDFVPDPAITQYLTDILESVVFQDAPAGTHSPLEVAEGALAKNQAEQQAGHAFWEMAIRHYQLSELDYFRMEQAASVLHRLGSLDSRNILMSLAYNIWAWHVATAWVLILANHHRLHLMSELQRLVLNPAAPSGGYTLIN